MLIDNKYFYIKTYLTNTHCQDNKGYYKPSTTSPSYNWVNGINLSLEQWLLVLLSVNAVRSTSQGVLGTGPSVSYVQRALHRAAGPNSHLLHCNTIDLTDFTNKLKQIL